MDSDSSSIVRSHEWLAASEALDLVCKHNGKPGAKKAIARRAHAGLVISKAEHFSYETADNEGKLRKELFEVELPKQFWWAEGASALEQDWNTGDFVTWIKRRFEWKAFGVSFERRGIEAMLVTEESAPTEKGTGKSIERIEAPLPPAAEILAKLLELIEQGHPRDDVAKMIKSVPRFEGVGNEYARALMRGHLRIGRPKRRQEN